MGPETKLETDILEKKHRISISRRNLHYKDTNYIYKQTIKRKVYGAYSNMMTLGGNRKFERT